MKSTQFLSQIKFNELHASIQPLAFFSILISETHFAVMSSLLRRTLPSLMKNLSCQGKFIPKPNTIIIRTGVNKVDKMPIGLKKVEKLLIQDKTPKGFQLIYYERSALSTMCWHHLSIIASIGTMLSAWLFFRGDTQAYHDIRIKNWYFSRSDNQARVFFALSLLLCWVFWVVTYKIPFRIYHNPTTKSYRIVGISRIPLVKHINECKEGDVMERRLSIYRMLNFGNEFTINRRHYVIEYRNFRTPADQYTFLGYYDESGLHDESEQ